MEDPENAVEVAAVRGYRRMVRAERRLTDLKCPLQLHPGTLQVPKRPQHAAKVVVAVGHVRVIWAEHRLADRQRPLQLHLGTLQLPKGLQHAAEVAAPSSHVEVVGAQGRLTDRQRPLVLRLGALQVPKGQQHTAEVAVIDGHETVAGPEGRLADRYCSLQLHPGTLQVAQVLQHAAEVIEAAYKEREVEDGRWVNLTDLARELGTSKAYVQRVISPLRVTHRQRTTSPAPAADVSSGEGRGWLELAACKDSDPELFFPERGEKAKGQAAKQVCASCQVQQQCRDLAVRTARSREEDHGIFAGTTPHERSGLRGHPAPGPSIWYTDRAAAEQAHRLAVQVGPVAAAEQLGTATSTLARAFARWGLDYPGRPRASTFARDPDRAREAFALAEHLGSVKAAARELGSSRPALVAGWQRFGLGMPDTSHPTARGPAARAGRTAESEGRLAPAFVTLNQEVLPVRASSEAERFWRVRRAEQYATLGAAAVTELHSESRSARASARVWAITRRAQRAQTLASQRATRAQRRQAERAQRDHPGYRRRSPREREVSGDAR